MGNKPIRLWSIFSEHDLYLERNRENISVGQGKTGAACQSGQPADIMVHALAAEFLMILTGCLQLRDAYRTIKKPCDIHFIPVLLTLLGSH
jgi:hypothetical protein